MFQPCSPLSLHPYSLEGPLSGGCHMEGLLLLPINLIMVFDSPLHLHKTILLPCWLRLPHPISVTSQDFLHLPSVSPWSTFGKSSHSCTEYRVGSGVRSVFFWATLLTAVGPWPLLYSRYELFKHSLWSSWLLNLLKLFIFPALDTTHTPLAQSILWTRGLAFSQTRPRRAVGSAPWTIQLPEVSSSLAHICTFPGPAGILSIKLMEGATARFSGFPRFQESIAASVKAELLPLRSHTSL